MKKQTEIVFNKPCITGNDLCYIEHAVLKGSHLSGDGPFTKRCHAWLEKELGCTKALLTHSCTAALEMSAILLDIHQGDEAIMPSFTFVSTANAFVLRGAVPVFIDIRPDTLNIDEQKIEQAITPKTRVIVPMHYGGVPCAMDEILDIADQRGLFVVEDAAHALLSTYKGRFLSTIGQLGCLSFHETKNITSGEGGALLINDLQFIDRAEIIREKGTNRVQFIRGEVEKYTWTDIGSSFLPGELVAAFLLGQLERAEEITARRRRIFEKYHRSLCPLEERGYMRLPFIGENCSSNGHIFYIITESPKVRTRLIEYLETRNVMATSHYVPLHSSPAGKKYGRTIEELHVTNDLSHRLLRLPLYADIREDDMNKIIECVKGFYGEKG